MLSCARTLLTPQPRFLPGPLPKNDMLADQRPLLARESEMAAAAILSFCLGARGHRAEWSRGGVGGWGGGGEAVAWKQNIVWRNGVIGIESLGGSVGGAIMKVVRKGKSKAAAQRDGPETLHGLVRSEKEYCCQ